LYPAETLAAAATVALLAQVWRSVLVRRSDRFKRQKSTRSMDGGRVGGQADPPLRDISLSRLL